MNARVLLDKCVIFMYLVLARNIGVVVVLIWLDLTFQNQPIPHEIWSGLLAEITIPLLVIMIIGNYKLCVPSGPKFLVGFMWYTFVLDSLFALHHYVMHNNQYLYKYYHYVHHSSSGVLTTKKGLLSHPVDGLTANILVVFWILSVEPNIITLSVAYSLLNVWGILLHTGLNKEIHFWNFLVSPMDHQIHHSCVTVNYAGFYSIWDRLFHQYSQTNCK